MEPTTKFYAYISGTWFFPLWRQNPILDFKRLIHFRALVPVNPSGRKYRTYAYLEHQSTLSLSWVHKQTLWLFGRTERKAGFLHNGHEHQVVSRISPPCKTSPVRMCVGIRFSSQITLTFPGYSIAKLPQPNLNLYISVFSSSFASKYFILLFIFFLVSY